LKHNHSENPETHGDDWGPGARPAPGYRNEKEQIIDKIRQVVILKIEDDTPIFGFDA
jgi:hypothetical protein